MTLSLINSTQPHHRPRKPRIYFAGKIAKNDWRHSLTGGHLRDAIDPSLNDGDLFNPNFTLDCEDYVYCGPFFVCCDHGCAHGDNRHGAIGACTSDSCGEPLNEWQARIFDVNLRRLRMADFVFAYIEKADAYGTLIELGIAYGWRIPIALRLPTAPRPAAGDMWMAARTARRIYHGDAEECWKEFCADFLVGASACGTCGFETCE